MGDDEFPSAADLAERYHPRIASEQADLAARSSDTKADRAPVTLDQQGVGRLSRIDALQGQAMARAMEARRLGRLRALAAAEQRLGEGTFGACDECGGFIGWRRLDLDPATIRCVGCAG